MAAQAIGASARTPAYPGGGVPASRRAMERVGGSGCERRLGVHVPSRPWKPTRRWSSKNLQARASGNANWARGIGLPRKRNGDGEDDEDDEVTTMDARSGVYGTQGGGYYDEYGDALTEEERKQAIYAESRRATKKFLDNPITEVSFALLTLVLCLCLAVNTLPLTPLEDAVTSRVEDVIAVIFAWELFARWWIEELKPKFWLGPYTIVDALSLLPPVLGDAYSIAATLRVLRILRLARLLQPKDFNRIVNLITGKDRDLPTYYSKIATVVFTIFCIVFINAGLIYQAEHIGNPQFGTFFDALYFSVTTLTTVGFGDITPITAAGKATVSFSILTGVLLVPTELSALASAICSRRKTETRNPRA
mmetsp:Transcript_30409/g.97174  ORF Transcript_30409/g.97174 Transcript_30409/m.97174 type:complete len:364 (-) Transcript_30409:18-1109(-)